MSAGHSISRRVAALVALVALGAALVLPVLGLGHASGTDVDRLALSAVAHHPTSQFERVIDRTDDGHCLACHLHRTFSGANVHATRQTTPPARLAHYASSDSALIALRDRRAISLRGPPPGFADSRQRPSLAA